MHLATYFLILFANLSLPQVTAEIKDYSHVSSSDGIDMYERWIETGNGESVREMMVTMQSKSRIGALVKALGNEVLFKTWHKGLAQCIISDHRGSAWKVYLQYSTPWPMSNQECMVQYRVARHTDEHLHIDFYSLDKAALPGTNRVDRILGVQGSWAATLGPSGEIHIVYRILSQKSTSVPTWVSDPFVRKNTTQSFKALIELLASL